MKWKKKDKAMFLLSIQTNYLINRNTNVIVELDKKGLLILKDIIRLVNINKHYSSPFIKLYHINESALKPFERSKDSLDKAIYFNNKIYCLSEELEKEINKDKVSFLEGLTNE